MLQQVFAQRNLPTILGAEANPPSSNAVCTKFSQDGSASLNMFRICVPVRYHKIRFQAARNLPNCFARRPSGHERYLMMTSTQLLSASLEPSASLTVAWVVGAL